MLDYYQPSLERDFEHFLDYAIHVNDFHGNAAIEEATRLYEEGYSIHYHVFLPSDVLELLRWISANLMPIRLLEGPAMSPSGDEFHFLVEKK